MPTRPIPPEARLAALAASRALIAVGAVAGVVAALAASSPVRRHPQHRTPASDADVDRVLRAAGASGPGRAVWAWNPRFTAGDPGAEPLLRTFTWVAARDEDAAPRGTLTVRQSADGSGSLTVLGTDGDDALARALGTLAPDEVLVSDDGDWLAVGGDVVRPLLAAPRTDLTARVSVADHRATLRARRDRAAPGDRDDDARRAGTPADDPTGR